MNDHDAAHVTLAVRLASPALAHATVPGRAVPYRTAAAAAVAGRVPAAAAAALRRHAESERERGRELGSDRSARARLHGETRNRLKTGGAGARSASGRRVVGDGSAAFPHQLQTQQQQQPQRRRPSRRVAAPSYELLARLAPTPAELKTRYRNDATRTHLARGVLATSDRRSRINSST